jgi:hypothetical protein
MSLSETATLVSSLQKELRRVIVGQDEVITEILIAFLAGGHCLLAACRAWPRRCSSDARRSGAPQIQPHPIHA